MREYEVIVILKPDLEDAARAELVERLEGWMSHGEGEESAPIVNHWGQRSLAYSINKYTEGYYLFFEATLEPSNIGQMEKDMQYVDDILRHMVVRKES